MSARCLSPVSILNQTFPAGLGILTDPRWSSADAGRLTPDFNGGGRTNTGAGFFSSSDYNNNELAYLKNKGERIYIYICLHLHAQKSPFISSLEQAIAFTCKLILIV